MDTAPMGTARGIDATVLRAAAGCAVEYATSFDGRRVAPGPEALAALVAFDEAHPDLGADPVATIRLLHDVGSPATVRPPCGSACRPGRPAPATPTSPPT